MVHYDSITEELLADAVSIFGSLGCQEVALPLLNAVRRSTASLLGSPRIHDLVAIAWSRLAGLALRR